MSEAESKKVLLIETGYIPVNGKGEVDEPFVRTGDEEKLRELVEGWHWRKVRRVVYADD